MKRNVVLLAKSAIAAQPLSEMARLAQMMVDCGDTVSYAFSDQGEPTLRSALESARRNGADEVLILPLVLPMEPSFRAWMAQSVQRWRKTSDGPWPTIRIGRGPVEAAAIKPLLEQLLESARNASAVPNKEKKKPQGSVVPIHERRILICQGGPCNDGGGAALWAHMHAESKRLDLKNVAGGTLCARAGCLGTCNLAPVVQVYPEGTFYGGVDEAGLDRIIAEHILGGRVVEDLAYPATGTKQRLRADGEDNDAALDHANGVNFGMDDSPCH